MDRQFSTKINKLLHSWPKGTVAAQSWLEQQGIDRRLTEVYRRSGWVERIAPGAYIQAGDKVEWSGAIYTLQHQLGLKVHVGATTALLMAGLAHYMPLGKGGLSWVFVDATETRKIPTWFKKCFSERDNIQVVKTKLFTKLSESALTKVQFKDYSIEVSAPERALLECMYFAPDSLTLEHASQLMEHARALRPNVAKALLENCQSVKVKRLFLYLAELHQHNWFKRIDLEKINLGSGTRQIGKGGYYVAKYKLSLPNLTQHEGYPDEGKNE